MGFFYLPTFLLYLKCGSLFLLEPTKYIFRFLKKKFEMMMYHNFIIKVKKNQIEKNVVKF